MITENISSESEPKNSMNSTLEKDKLYGLRPIFRQAYERSAYASKTLGNTQKQIDKLKNFVKTGKY